MILKIMKERLFRVNRRSFGGPNEAKSALQRSKSFQVGQMDTGLI